MGIYCLEIIACYDYMEFEEPSEFFRSAIRVGLPRTLWPLHVTLN